MKPWVLLRMSPARLIGRGYVKHGTIMDVARHAQHPLIDIRVRSVTHKSCRATLLKSIDDAIAEAPLLPLCAHSHFLALCLLAHKKNQPDSLCFSGPTQTFRGRRSGPD